MNLSYIIQTICRSELTFRRCLLIEIALILFRLLENYSLAQHNAKLSVRPHLYFPHWLPGRALRNSLATAICTDYASHHDHFNGWQLERYDLRTALRSCTAND